MHWRVLPCPLSLHCGCLWGGWVVSSFLCSIRILLVASSCGVTRYRTAISVSGSPIGRRLIRPWVIDGSLWRIKGHRWGSIMLAVIVVVHQDRLLIRYRNSIRSCYWYRDFNSHRYFHTNWNMDGNFYPDWNMNRNLNRNVLDDRHSNRNGLWYSVGLSNRYRLGHSIRYSIRLWHGHRSSHWIRNTVSFAESLFKTFSKTIMMSSGGNFVFGC